MGAHSVLNRKALALSWRRAPLRQGDQHGKGSLRCAVYTRKSSEEGLEQDFNSLDAQREEACFTHQQASWRPWREGWMRYAGSFADYARCWKSWKA